MFLRDHRYAFDQELKELVHGRLADVAKNTCLGAHRRFFITGLLIRWGTMYRMMLLHISYCYCINFKWTIFQSGCLSYWQSKNEI